VIDPRPAVIGRRLGGVGSILAVASGKGGVGKSTCAAAGALALARAGLAVGLLDLDFQGASCHTITGISPRLPAEDHGLEPLEGAWGLRFASIVSFIGERPAAMRGADLANALREILAVTIWGKLDALLIDMPPGIHDTALELGRLVPACRNLVVATPSRVALAVASRLVAFLREARSPIVGMVENMAAGAGAGSAVADAAHADRVPFLGSLPFDASLEQATGDPAALTGTPLAVALRPILFRAIGRE
jgi:ATP-binding protein involved in chromosome partitioning